jgi:S1-C subfamily serine protease
MNFVDFIILIFLLLALLRGFEIGAVRQVFSAIGLLSGLFLGTWLSHWFVHYAHTTQSRSWTALLCTLTVAMILLGVGEYFGLLLKSRLSRNHEGDSVDRAVGVVIGVATAVVTIWLAAAVLVRLPYTALQTDIRGSGLIKTMDQALPSAPNLIADLSQYIDPNGFPTVFSGGEPVPIHLNTPTPTPAQFAAAVNADETSVVKVEGLGCGGIVEGSGFVVANGLVATNAHVVAGVTSPYVLDNNGQHHATVIWFDPNLDFAVLQVSNLAGNPLSINTNDIANGTNSVVMGFPGGSGFTATPAVLLDEFQATGTNIYGQGNTNRLIYEVKATVIPGNSGGPLATTNGQVIGIVFAQSTTYNQVGYALAMKQVVNELHQAEANPTPTSSGACAE